MLTGGSADQNLAEVISENANVEDLLSRVRSLLVFSVENRGSKIDTRGGIKKADVMMERWKSIFSKYDVNSSGTLSHGDVKRMVRRDLKIAERLVTDGQIDLLFQAIDQDGNGLVDFHEFISFVQQPSTRGAVSEQSVVDSVARSVRLALKRNKIRVKDLEENFYSFDESGEVATGELGASDMVRFFRKVLKLTTHESSDKALHIAFYAMDDDGSGKMSLEELMEFLTFCNDGPEEKVLPARIQGLIGGMRGSIPERVKMGRPGGQTSKMPFCLNGRNIASCSRLGATQRCFVAKSESEPSLATMALRALPQSPIKKKEEDADAASDADENDESMDNVDSPRRSAPQEFMTPEPKPKKRVWNGKLPGKTRGGYMLLKGADSLNHVEERLFEAGIDVRGHYHKLGRDRF